MEYKGKGEHSVAELEAIIDDLRTQLSVQKIGVDYPEKIKRLEANITSLKQIIDFKDEVIESMRPAAESDLQPPINTH